MATTSMKGWVIGKRALRLSRNLLSVDEDAGAERSRGNFFAGQAQPLPQIRRILVMSLHHEADGIAQRKMLTSSPSGPIYLSKP